MAIAVFSGRAHPYEGYSHREATILLRAVLSLGPGTVVLTNAAGGINPAFAAGEVMLIRDTINLSGENPLLGPNLDAFGPRFPALTDALGPAACASWRGERRRVPARRCTRGCTSCSPARPTRRGRSCACSA